MFLYLSHILPYITNPGSSMKATLLFSSSSPLSHKHCVVSNNTWSHSGCECSGHRRSSEPWGTPPSTAAAGPDPQCWPSASHHTVGTRPLKDRRTPPPPQHLWENKKHKGSMVILVHCYPSLGTPVGKCGVERSRFNLSNTSATNNISGFTL